MSILRTTKLGAINTMLATIGESPINTLEDTELLDAITAIQTLDEVTLETLGEGWSFNTTENFTLKVSASEPYEIRLPSDALQVFLKDDREGRFRVRGDRVFDDVEQTFDLREFGKMNARVFWAYPFDDLPEAARRYISIRAARMFQDRFVGSDSIHSYSRNDEMFAYGRLKRFETRSARPNLLNNAAAARVLKR